MSRESRNRKRIELSLYRELDAIYAQLPVIHCKGLCAHACTTIAASVVETHRLNQATGMRYPWLRRSKEVWAGLKEPAPCPLLKDGKCTAYAVRPFVCRAYGAVIDLPCPHGCQPEGGPMGAKESQALHFQILHMKLPPELGEYDPEQTSGFTTGRADNSHIDLDTFKPAEPLT